MAPVKQHRGHMGYAEFVVEYFADEVTGRDGKIAFRPLPGLERVIEVGGQTWIEAERGCGKTMQVGIAAIWAVFALHRRFPLLLSGSFPAADWARLLYKRVEENEKLRAAYPDVDPMLYDRGTTLALEPYGAIAVRGIWQSLTDLTWNGERPDVILVDEPPGTDEANSPTMTTRLRHHLKTHICGMGAPGAPIPVFLVGTSTCAGDIFALARAEGLLEGRDG